MADGQRAGNHRSGNGVLLLRLCGRVFCVHNLFRMAPERAEGERMKTHHWIGAVVLLVVGYFVGTKYPAFWTKFTGA